MGMVCPEIDLALSEARNSASAAIGTHSCPSQHSAVPRVKTGAGVPVAGEAVMVIPTCGCHRRVRRELLLSEDSGLHTCGARRPALPLRETNSPVGKA
jgi:hypothetical protein